MSAAPPSLRVLVVDDDRSVREVLTKVLIQKGFAVTASASGEDALAQLGAAKFVLMLLDLRMPPGLNGLDVLPQALDLDPDLRIIMLTAAADTTTAARAMHLGAKDFLTKPVDLASLYATIDKVLA
jgi:DNA-binding NtrC family response regulator